MQWQTMETAPVDGTRVLGYADGEFATVSFNPHGYWDLCVCGGGTWEDDGKWAPTHWMNLPPEPGAENQRRA